MPISVTDRGQIGPASPGSHAGIQHPVDGRTRPPTPTKIEYFIIPMILQPAHLPEGCPVWKHLADILLRERARCALVQKSFRQDS